jgi:hypothetical protein
MRKKLTWVVIGLMAALAIVAAVHGLGHPTAVADVTDPGVY